MAVKIKPKRGTGSPAGNIEANEIAMDTAAKKLYVSTDGTDAVVLAENISNNDTDDLTEGSTNLYYTDARADARAQLKIDALVDSAPGTLDTLNELAAALGDDANFSGTVTTSIATKLATADFAATFDTRLATKDTGNVSEGSNLYYTNARADARVNLQTGSNLDLSNKSTSDLTEGTNLYYTDARAQAVSINNVVEDSTPQLGGDLDLNGNFVKDGNNDVLEVDSGALKLYHDGDLQVTTGQYETTFENDVVSTGFFAVSPSSYESRILRSFDRADFEKASLEIGSEGAGSDQPQDINVNFSLFDGGFGSSDRTATPVQINAFYNGTDDSRLTFMVDDGGSLVKVAQHRVDDTDIKHIFEGHLTVKKGITAENDGFSQLTVQKQSDNDEDAAIMEFVHDDADADATAFLSAWSTQKTGTNERKTRIRHYRDDSSGDNRYVLEVDSNLETDAHTSTLRGKVKIENPDADENSNNLENIAYANTQTNHDMIRNNFDFESDTPATGTTYKQNFNFTVMGDNLPNSGNYQFGRMEAGYKHGSELEHYIALRVEDEAQDGQNFLEVNNKQVVTNAPVRLAQIDSGTSDPGSPNRGDYFFNTTNSPSELKRWNGSAWQIISDEGTMFYDNTETRLTVREGSNWVRYTSHVV